MNRSWLCQARGTTNVQALTNACAAPQEGVTALRKAGPVGIAQVQQRLSEPPCPQLCPVCAGVGSVADAAAEVLYVTAMGAEMLQVPFYKCPDCKGEASLFHEPPAAVGCFPTTPVRALQLKRESQRKPPIWVDTLCLELMLQLQHACPGTSLEGICRALENTAAAANDFQLDAKRLQEHLNDALPQYAAVQAAVEDPATHGCAEYLLSDGPLDCCGACYQAGRRDPETGLEGHTLHIYVDGCMKMGQYEFAGKLGSQLLPDWLWRIATVPDTVLPMFRRMPELRGSGSACKDIAAQHEGVKQAAKLALQAQKAAAKAAAGSSQAAARGKAPTPAGGEGSSAAGAAADAAAETAAADAVSDELEAHCGKFNAAKVRAVTFSLGTHR